MSKIEERFRVVQVPIHRIGNNWKLFSWHIMNMLPEEERTNLARTNILDALLRNSYQLWVGFDLRKYDMVSLALTGVGINPLCGTKELIIFGLVNLQGLNKAVVLAGMEEFKKLAKKEGIERISLKTDVESIQNILVELGAKNNNTYTLEV